ncbi:Serine/threonine-protein kinase Sgk1 [Thelohanellus kitauei]|uniref:Serine/threonine-protein kinase Sgk1 n=1 Tax=Thelohanellus kitauei TaxID=669202 RepID=A0A0C2MKD6_THEKT|nr:Serine/threonine-protein kinase Sgk1 [Thelohanellus kitauei]
MLHGTPPFYSEDTAQMYKSIIEKDIQVFVSCSIPCRSLISSLLKKNPEERLGYGPNDWNDIKAHYFFKDINWDDLLSRKITPPFNPGVTDELDFKHISSEFLDQEITDSIVCNADNPLHDDKGQANKFVGFTYVHEPDFD